ncbi:hypothetical protein AVEN_59081-1 [Araneus ventricosus]|uniref:Uncharacterized protein n=1 Tax=Araneus ventricosus TaxID=182803 RepID=A0A4Y2RGI5_ARAVE|nr:hypothetical protein AVEN_59081-1 [Araneus ventricosus]
MIPIYSSNYPDNNSTYIIYVHSTHFPSFLQSHVLRYYKNVILYVDILYKKTPPNYDIELAVTIERDNFNFQILECSNKKESILKYNNMDLLYDLIVNDAILEYTTLTLYNVKKDFAVSIVTSEEQRKDLKDMRIVGYLPAKYNFRNVKDEMCFEDLLRGKYQNSQNVSSSDTDTESDYELYN